MRVGAANTHPLHAELLGAIAGRICAYLLTLRDSLRLRQNRLRALFVLLCLACTLAVGQGSPATPAPPVATATSDSYTFTADSLIGRIAGKVTEKLDALKNNTQLQRFGSYLTGFFLSALLVWTSVKTMTTGRGLSDLLAEWVPIFVSFGIVILFLDRSAADLIVRTMDGVAGAIGGVDMATLDAAVRAGAAPILKAIAAVVAQPRATEATNVMGEGVLGWLGTLAASGASWIMGAIAKVGAAFFLVLAGVVMAAHIILGFVSVQLVLALAPIAVPFLMFRPMDWLFNGWLWGDRCRMRPRRPCPPRKGLPLQDCGLGFNFQGSQMSQFSSHLSRVLASAVVTAAAVGGHVSAAACCAGGGSKPAASRCGACSGKCGNSKAKAVKAKAESKARQGATCGTKCAAAKCGANCGAKCAAAKCGACSATK